MAVIANEVTADENVFAGAGFLFGYAFRNTSASAIATVYIRDGTTDTDKIVVPIQLAAGESARDWFGPQGVRMNVGVRVDVSAGAIEGSCFVG